LVSRTIVAISRTRTTKRHFFTCRDVNCPGSGCGYAGQCGIYILKQEFEDQVLDDMSKFRATSVAVPSGIGLCRRVLQQYAQPPECYKTHTRVSTLIGGDRLFLVSKHMCFLPNVGTRSSIVVQCLRAHFDKGVGRRPKMHGSYLVFSSPLTPSMLVGREQQSRRAQDDCRSTQIEQTACVLTSISCTAVHFSRTRATQIMIQETALGPFGLCRSGDDSRAVISHTVEG
jgi:hypothetical protein